ncbi:MAG: ImmA/IrrE family metallo-endopeptidase [Chloroflexota bacterium]
MTVRIRPSAVVLEWARHRSRVPSEELLSRFPQLPDWAAGTRQPTLKQLERFAQATHTPIGYLFLHEPPEEHLPLPDFRTIGGVEIGEASPDLLDTIYQCQQRQDWYRDYARIQGQGRVPFVGTLTSDSDVVPAARQMRETLDFEASRRGSSWSEALRRLIDEADANGILVMVSGIVGSNTHRKLDPREFRGFALVDEFAPVVFINGADAKAAQIFTLAHELAHIWLGQTAVSNADMEAPSTNVVERWCNEVAAEFLIPLADLRGLRPNLEQSADELQALARRFKVSTLVALRRIFDGGYLAEPEFRAAYRQEWERVRARLEEQSSAGGGNFYNTQPLRVSKRFARALIENTLEGQTLHRDAYQMLGFKKHSTFDELANHLGVR